MQVALGQWLADNTPAGATIACNDIGAIGYFSNRRILDLRGLVTKGRLGYRGDREGAIAFVNDRKPDFLIIFPVLYPGLKDAPFLKVVAYADVRDNTVILFDFRPHARTIAGVLILDLVIRPVPVTMAVFKCNWDMLPP